MTKKVIPPSPLFEQLGDFSRRSGITRTVIRKLVKDPASGFPPAIQIAGRFYFATTMLNEWVAKKKASSSRTHPLMTVGRKQLEEIE